MGGGGGGGQKRRAAEPCKEEEEVAPPPTFLLLRPAASGFFFSGLLPIKEKTQQHHHRHHLLRSNCVVARGSLSVCPHAPLPSRNSSAGARRSKRKAPSNAHLRLRCNDDAASERTHWCSHNEDSSAVPNFRFLYHIVFFFSCLLAFLFFCLSFSFQLASTLHTKSLAYLGAYILPY